MMGMMQFLITIYRFKMTNEFIKKMAEENFKDGAKFITNLFRSLIEGNEDISISDLKDLISKIDKEPSLKQKSASD